jgi:pyruvate kinase
MNAKVHEEAEGAWDRKACDALIDDLWSLRESMLEHQMRLGPWLREVDAAHVASAINLAHYLAMRRHDLRSLQERLSWIGVSSLGRAETHVLANLDKVLGILHRLAGRDWTELTRDEPTGSQRGPALLARHDEALFGPALPERSVRVMVTLPSEAARDDRLVEGLVRAGMDIARINCAHDGAAEWEAMAARVRRAARGAGRRVRVLMDLGGPKLRTGAIEGGVAVVRIKPARDDFGRVTAEARLGLRPRGSKTSIDGVALCLGVDPDWLARLAIGDPIELTDARGAQRRWTVVESGPAGVAVSCPKTAYLTDATRLRIGGRGDAAHESPLADLPAPTGQLLLQRGEQVRLVSQGLGRPARPAAPGRRARRATIACTLPEALDRLRPGERVWFDDGRIGGVIRRRSGKGFDIEITQAREGGEPLRADKGINLPDTHLDLPALTAKDLQDLDTVARHADMVGLSFAQSAQDVRALRAQLVQRGAGHLGLILKIETRRGFEHLPEMLLAAMSCSAAGVMIARGDLAVECGYERMAEVQEEILWACEAAHMPVVWATQVLETLAKTGLPSRAEITDAAMGERAECVMLNKGPHILDAIRTLDDILRRMQSHQTKKRPLLRALKAWNHALETALPASPEVAPPLPRASRRPNRINT